MSVLRLEGIHKSYGDAEVLRGIDLAVDAHEVIAVIGASDVIDEALITRWTATATHPGIASAKGPDQLRLVAAVTAARADSDTIVVDLHWGEEGADCPTPRQEELAQSLVDAGADIVVGSHSHRVETAGRLGTAFVDYGLGNFVFYARTAPTQATGVLALTVEADGVRQAQWTPARISDGVPVPLLGSGAAQAVAAKERLRGCTGLSATAP